MDASRTAFAELVAPGRGAITGELDVGALLIAAAIAADVVVEAELARLDDLADEVSGRIPTAGAQVTVAELAAGLFGGARPDPQVHFAGNQSDYYDPANSLLPRVLDRRQGIPITLSIVMIEIGRRLGVSLHGVGMPGHFLVGSANGFVDPFHGGTLLDIDGCAGIFRRLAGPDAVLPAGALDPTPPAMILKRILHNLSAVASNAGDRRVLLAVRSLLAVFPDATHRDHVQHAYAASGLAQYGEAAAAAERALATLPENVRPRLEQQIDSWRAQLN